METREDYINRLKETAKVYNILAVDFLNKYGKYAKKSKDVVEVVFTFEDGSEFKITKV